MRSLHEGPSAPFFELTKRGRLAPSSSSFSWRLLGVFGAALPPTSSRVGLRQGPSSSSSSRAGLRQVSSSSFLRRSVSRAPFPRPPLEKVPPKRKSSPPKRSSLPVLRLAGVPRFKGVGASASSLALPIFSQGSSFSGGASRRSRGSAVAFSLRFPRAAHSVFSFSVICIDFEPAVSSSDFPRIHGGVALRSFLSTTVEASASSFTLCSRSCAFSRLWPLCCLKRCSNDCNSV
mmetsp:Transcript_94580/g.149555  ORF Transcript_94580/g.149555 Transcript_94580/m.149555 type:complete len:233 (-) Transcript_94580:1242-1940(-)